MLHNRSMCSSIVIPELPCRDVEATTAWLAAAFGFTLRIGMGSHRAQLSAGGGHIVLTQSPSPGPCSVMVRVDDVDAHYARAIGRGVRILRAPTNYPYGERQYNAEDLNGHSWCFSQSIADVDPRDWGGVPSSL